MHGVVVYKAGGEKNIKKISKYIVRKYMGREQQPVMNRHDDNDNWLTTLTLIFLLKTSVNIEHNNYGSTF